MMNLLSKPADDDRGWQAMVSVFFSPYGNALAVCQAQMSTISISFRAYPITAHELTLSRSKMTKRERLLIHSSSAAASHDHELGTCELHTVSYNLVLMFSLTRLNTGIPRAGRIGTIQQQKRVSGKNPKVTDRIAFICHILTLPYDSRRTQNPIRGASKDGGVPTKDVL
jgi:hypothetical protein